MSSPIKPPDGLPPVSVEGPQGPDSPERAEEAREAFAEAIERKADAPLSGAEARGPLDGLADALRAGTIEPDQAVDVLVRRAMQTPGTEHLSPSARAALESHLRGLFVDDPAFGGLLKDLSRSVRAAREGE